MARKIVVTSGKGGVGKTTVALRLAERLAEFDLKVLVVDGDFGLNNLDLALGVEDRAVYDLCDVLNGRCRLKQALIKVRDNLSLYALASNKLYDSEFFSVESVKASLMVISKLFDYIIIDSPAGIEEGFIRAINCADEAVGVVNSCPSSLRDADKVIGALKSYGIEKINIVINRLRGDMVLDGVMLSPDNIKELLQYDILGVIPEDDLLLSESNLLLSKRSGAYKAFLLTAKKLHQGKGAYFDVTKKYRGFTGSIRRSLRGSV